MKDDGRPNPTPGAKVLASLNFLLTAAQAVCNFHPLPLALKTEQTGHLKKGRFSELMTGEHGPPGSRIGNTSNA
jgi:hypothetical protein